MGWIKLCATAQTCRVIFSEDISATRLHILPYSSLLSSGPMNPIHPHIVSTPKFALGELHLPCSSKGTAIRQADPCLLKGKISWNRPILYRLEILICEPLQSHHLGYISAAQGHTPAQALTLPMGKPPKNTVNHSGRGPTLSSLLEGYTATGALVN